MGRVIAIVAILALLIGGGGGYWAGTHGQLLSAHQVAAADECQTFSQTGKQVCGRFLEYWKANGGLAQQGLPLSNEMQDKSDTDGKTYTVQYFERAVFESHPENTRPYDVLLSLVGSEKYSRRYPVGLPSGTYPIQAGQTFTLYGSKSGGTFQATITNVTTRASLLGGYPEKEVVPQGVFFIVLMRVTNTGNEPNYLYDAFKIKDAQGRSFDQSSTYNADKLFNADSYSTTIQPSFTKDIVFVYDVAKDYGSFTLTPRTK